MDHLSPALQERLSQLKQQQPGAMILVLDLEGTYLYVSEESGQVLGYEPNEVVGHHALEFAAPADVSHGALTLQDALLNGESVTVGIDVLTKAEGPQPIRGAAYRFDDEEAGQTYITGWVARTPLGG